MLATKMLESVAPEVILKECVAPLPSVNKVAHYGFET